MRHEAIYNLYSNVQFIDDGAGAFDAQGNQVTVDEAAVAAEIARLEADYAAKEYQRNRAAEYPSFADQFDLLYHGGYDAWKAAVQAVKDRYPKE
jgi:hypothetical protein